jgi:hypothetical protein
MPQTPEETQKIIGEVITHLMEGVLNNALYKKPFIFDKWKAEKPLYAALVPKEIFKGSHFERKFVTPFGHVWEKLAKVVGENFHGYAVTSQLIEGNVPEERLRRITEVINRLEHSEKGKKRIKPNWDEEISYILEGDGNPIPVKVVSDVFIKNLKDGRSFAFEVKSPLPNSDVTKVSKEKMFKLYAMQPRMITDAFFALPYNPYGKRENYAWSFPERWFQMKTDRNVLIGDDFWDLIGGQGTYQMFVTEINKLGLEYRHRIYREFLNIEPPSDDLEIKL